MNTKIVGDVTVLAVMQALVSAGYAVAVPWGDRNRYDLIAEREGQFWRIQCKTAWRANGCMRFNTSNKSTDGGAPIRRAYKGQIDCFLVRFPESNTLYCVPIADASATDMLLRLDPPQLNDPRIKWARDYEFKILPPLVQR